MDAQDTGRTRSGLRRAGFFLAAIVVAFLVGYVPMWLTARTRATERDSAQQAARLAAIENSVAAAAILARRGDYEPARDAASRFYTALLAELDLAEPVLPAAGLERLQALVAERDQLITLLARSDPAAAERLANTYVAFRQAMGTLP
jgi:hypothetical protein